MGSIVAILWMFICVPLAIVVFLDWFRKPTGPGHGRMLRHVARVPVFLFGIGLVRSSLQDGAIESGGHGGDASSRGDPLA